jgi:pyruvate dehydrogenase E1 component alpha subunit
MIESRTYRLGPHNTADDPTRYVDPDELNARRELDPIRRVRAYLRGRGLLDEEAEQRIETELREEVERAVRAAEAFAPAHSGQIFEHVYGRPPARVESQRRSVEGR